MELKLKIFAGVLILLLAEALMLGGLAYDATHPIPAISQAAR